MTPPEEYRRNEFWIIVKALVLVWMVLGICALMVWAIVETFS